MDKSKVSAAEKQRFYDRVETFASEYRIAAADRFEDKCEAHLEVFKKRCESPIEAILLTCVVMDACLYVGDDLTCCMEGDKDWRSDPGDDEGVYIWTQGTVEHYRVDILIQVKGARGVQTIAVECDGHDYHERTKDQAKRDRKRDRYMTGKGILVLRYTGSEIWHNAPACAEEIIGQVTEQMAKLADG